jgi:hypothetical protein
MMNRVRKIICLSVFLLVAQFSVGQTTGNTADENAKPFWVNDTLFIKKDTAHSIFIDTTRNPEYYERLADFSMNAVLKDSYEENIKWLKSRNIELTKQNLDTFPRNWRKL